MEAINQHELLILAQRLQEIASANTRISIMCEGIQANPAPEAQRLTLNILDACGDINTGCQKLIKVINELRPQTQTDETTTARVAL